MGVHVGDVRPAEVSAVEDDAHVAVVIALGLRKHELELGHVHDAAGILFIEKRLAVGLVECDGVVEDWAVAVVLGVAVFHHGDVARLAVLVGGVVAHVNPVGFFAVQVPHVQEPVDLLRLDVLQEVAHLGIGVAAHALGEYRVVVGVVGIVLRRVALGDQRVEGDVEDQGRVPGRKWPQEAFDEQFLVHEPAKHQEGAYPQAAADAFPQGLPRHELGQVLPAVRVGHEFPVLFHLADAGPLHRGVLPVLQVGALVLVVHVGRAPHDFLRDEPGDVRDVDSQVGFGHGSSIFSGYSPIWDYKFNK